MKRDGPGVFLGNFLGINFPNCKLNAAAGVARVERAWGGGAKSLPGCGA